MEASEEQVAERPQGRLIPVPRWNDYHAWPSASGLRHLIFGASKNGFERVIKRVGRTILVSEDAFKEWVEAQHAASSEAAAKDRTARVRSLAPLGEEKASPRRRAARRGA